MHLLEVPPALSRPHVQGDDRVGEQVVSGPMRTVQDRAGIAHRDEQPARGTIVGGRHRHPASAAQEGIRESALEPRPGVASLVARGRHGGEAPEQRPVQRVVRAHEPARLVLAAGDPHDDQVPAAGRASAGDVGAGNEERGHGQAVAGGVVGHRHGSGRSGAVAEARHRLPRRGRQGPETRVQRRHVRARLGTGGRRHPAEGRASIRLGATHLQRVPQRRRKVPEDLPPGRVQRDHPPARRGDQHEGVDRGEAGVPPPDDEGCGLQRVVVRPRVRDREGPRDAEPRHVPSGHLAEPREALVSEAAAVGRPVGPRAVVRLLGDRRARQDQDDTGGEGKTRPEPAHGAPP